MLAAEILDTCKKLGISVYVEGDKLFCEPGSLLPPDLKPQIREHKAELIDLLAGMCFCQPPMPPADVEGQRCQRCDLAGWCVTCQGCRWCAFQLKWNDHLQPKFKKNWK